MDMRKTLKGLLAFVVAVAFVAEAYISYRNKPMDRLYAEAAGYPQFYRGSGESVDAVRKLATYRGRRSTSMLLNLALRNNPLAPEAQTEAIKALQERQDPEVASPLANLLQPHEGLKTRQAAATALRNLPCKGECIRAILHYLERIWRGEPNYEDRIVHLPGSEDVAASLKEDQEKLYGTLYSVLRRERMETLGAIMKFHGVGSSDPSPFGLELVSRLGVHEACPYLLQSDREIQQLPSEFYKAPRQELQAALTSLNCK